MHELKREKIRIRGKDINVITAAVEHPDMPAVRVTAEVPGLPGLPGFSVSRTITIGPADGPPMNLTLAKMQADVDAARQAVAETLAVHLEARAFIAQLK